MDHPANGKRPTNNDWQIISRAPAARSGLAIEAASTTVLISPPSHWLLFCTHRALWPNLLIDDAT